MAGIAPYADLRNVLQIATTDTYRDGRGRLHRFRADPELRDVLRDSLGQLELDPLTRATVVSLLDSRDPRQLDELYTRLPPSALEALDALSPLHRADRLTMPVELATSPNDKYFPVDASRRIVARAPHARLTVTTALDHAIPHAHDAGGVARLDGFVVRFLRDARRGD